MTLNKKCPQLWEKNTHLGSVSVSGNETGAAWGWCGWWGCPIEEWGDIMEVTEDEWLYILWWLSCEGCGSVMEGGREVMEPVVRLSPLWGLLSMSRPLILGWSIWNKNHTWGYLWSNLGIVWYGKQKFVLCLQSPKLSLTYFGPAPQISKTIEYTFSRNICTISNNHDPIWFPKLLKFVYR